MSSLYISSLIIDQKNKINLKWHISFLLNINLFISHPWPPATSRKTLKQLNRVKTLRQIRAIVVNTRPISVILFCNLYFAQQSQIELHLWRSKILIAEAEELIIDSCDARTAPALLLRRWYDAKIFFIFFDRGSNFILIFLFGYNFRRRASGPFRHSLGTVSLWCELLSSSFWWAFVFPFSLPWF